jgi:CubicO group peptidase (beta-lactamase class C family)
MLRKISTTILLILLWTAAVFAVLAAEAFWFGQPPVERGNRSSIENHLLKKLNDAARDKKLGSAALVLVENGKIVAEHGFGVTSIETNAPVKPDQTLFQLASVSKAVTAFGVMKLVEEQRIGLDEPVMRHLERWRFPGSEAHRDRVTVRQLLTHTAGLDDGAGFGVFLAGEKAQTLEESMSSIRITREPGSAMAYGNASTAVLQLLVEDITGRPFADFMKETVLIPLGMTKSGFALESLPEADLAPNFDARLAVQPRRRFAATGAVALYATARDLARFAAAFTGENPVLKSETVKQMLMPQPATGDSWGLGQTLFARTGGGYLAGHDGGSYPAWGAMLRVNPESGNAMILTVSGGSGAVNQLAHDWVYWETGTRTHEAKRQFFYDRMKGLGLILWTLGTIFIIVRKILLPRVRPQA